MTTFELTNNQRKYFGLDPIESHWERVIFKGDTYRPESILYYDNDTIKKHIISTDNKYSELHYNELTRDRNILLPKTNKGKEKKLSASVLDQRQPIGIYLSASNGDLTIGSYITQTTFFSNRWIGKQQPKKSIAELVSDFIEQSPENHLKEIELFKNAKRKNIKFKSGDYFCFKLDRTSFGFGRVLLDVNKIRKSKLIESHHGLSLLMGPPVIIEFFVYKSNIKKVDIAILDNQPKLPSDVMMDNLLLYGEYEIIGHRHIKDEEFDFPISYGRSIDQRKIVFLQWGLIHKELKQDIYQKYIFTEETQVGQNPYGYYSIGFRPHYDTSEIIRTFENSGVYDFANSKHYKAKYDLRNPKNKDVKNELFKAFGLDPNKSYFENSKLTATKLPNELINQL